MEKLTEFLLARIAEGEEAARAASQVRIREADGSHRGLTPVGEVEGIYVRYRQGEVRGHHIEGTALWQMFSPDRVLAECEAKRRIVELPDPGYFDAAADGWYEAHQAVLHLIGLPYADHPDYDPDWAVPGRQETR